MSYNIKTKLARLSEAWRGPTQISKMESFATVSND